MRIESRNRTSSDVTPLLVGLIFLLGGFAPVLAAPWEFGAVIDLGVVYTDNLRLDPEGMEESDFVYKISPTFSLTTEGDRLEADIRYKPEAYFFDTAPEADSVFHVVDASATATLVQDALFVNVSASNFQSILTPELGIPTGNVPISANRVDSRNLQIRPYWQQNLGFADILAEYSYAETRYDEVDSTPDSDLQNNDVQRGRFDLNNHSQQEGIAWGLQYETRRVKYDQSIPWDYQRAAANLGYWVNGTLRLFASGGLETAFDNVFDGDLDDEFWEAGFQYRPNQRLDLELAAGERGYGTSYRARLSYELRRGQMSLNYSEEPSTLGEGMLARRPLSDTDNLDDFLNRPGGSDRFIRKRGEWSTSIDLAKSDMSLRLFYEERFQTTTATGEDLQDENNRGAAFRWTWRLGAISTLGFTADYSERKTQRLESTLTRVSLEYSYRLSERLSAVAQAQRSEDDGEGQARNYVENQLELSLRATF